MVLVGLNLFWFVSSLVNVVLQPSGVAGSLIFLGSALCWGVGIFLWCRIDGKERGDPLTASENVAIVMFGLLALIWYLFKTRGAKGGFKALVWTLVYAIGSYIALVAMLTVAIVILKMAGVTHGI